VTVEYMVLKHCWNDADESIEVYQENPVVASHCTPKIPHRLACNCNRIFALRHLQLAARNMTQNI